MKAKFIEFEGTLPHLRFSKMGKSSGTLRTLFDLLLLGGLVGISIYLIIDAQNRKDDNSTPVRPQYK